MDYGQLYQGIVEKLEEQPINGLELKIILTDLRELRKGALTNPVTGYPNGRQRDEDLRIIRKDKERRKNKGNKTYAVILDVDNFGSFNKEYGMVVGDKILKGITEILEESLREDDQIRELSEEARGYHLHGEEMLVLYQCNSDEEAIKVAERIRRSVKEKSKEKIGYTTTVSLGVTEWAEQARESYEEAEERADKNMQKAKKEGRDRVYFG